MNKITQQMQKEMIARIVMAFFFIGTVHSQLLKEDKTLIDVIISKKDFTIRDSIYLKEESTNKRTREFFIRRNIKNTVFRPATIEELNLKTLDSGTRIKGRLIEIDHPVTTDKYIDYGKGVNKTAEFFLRDSFNYKVASLNKWTLNQKLKSKFIFNKTKANAIMTVSKPVYNLSMNKAIVHTVLARRKWQETTVYFLRKINSRWEIIYEQSKERFFICGI